MPFRVAYESRKIPPLHAQAPTATTKLGSGVALRVLTNANSIFRVAVPVTSNMSACLGEATKCIPSRVKSLTGLFSALKAAENTGTSGSSGSDTGFQPPPSGFADSPVLGAQPFDTMSREERRNLMREKFREAIERASALNQ